LAELEFIAVGKNLTWAIASVVLGITSWLILFGQSASAFLLVLLCGAAAAGAGFLARKRGGPPLALIGCALGCASFFLAAYVWIAILPAVAAKRKVEAGIRSRLAALANQTGASNPAPPPNFSAKGGVYAGELSLELTAPSASMVICYTLDGAEPTTNSPIYAAPIRIDRSTLFKAKGYDLGALPSVTAAQAYTILDRGLTNFTSNLPLVIINTFGQEIRHENKTTVSACFIELASGRSALTGPADFDGRADIHIRGSSTLRLPKHSYTFHTRDDSENKVKVPLLGFPKDSEWVLYAPYQDKSMIRDVLAYELFNKMGHYAPRTRFVEVFVSRSDGRLSKRDYQGVYVLMEKIKRSKHRVDIAALHPSDTAEPAITGGYLFKRDHSDHMGGGFYTRRGVQFLYVDPKDNELTPKQRAWLANYMNQFENALYGPDFMNPTNGYAAYLDLDSFIDQHWLIELSKNIDGFRYSTFLQKDRGGKIKLEPIWDWNLSFGNANYYDGWQVGRWYWPHLRNTEICWFRRLSQDPNFSQKCVARWAELRQNPFATSNLLARVDELAALLREAQIRNYQRWPILGQYVSPTWFTGQSYEDEIRWMKDWIRKRAAWMDGQLLTAPPVKRKPASSGDDDASQARNLPPARGTTPPVPLPISDRARVLSPQAGRPSERWQRWLGRPGEARGFGARARLQPCAPSHDAPPRRLPPRDKAISDATIHSSRDAL